MKDITLCVTSCGELTEKKCLKAIQAFRHKVDLVRIRNVYPQVKANNLMIESVKTEYFIPLDSDILLKRDAWSRISAALEAHRADLTWHSILFPLWDTLTQRRILALKLMRTEVMKENPFTESATPDVEHYGRLKSLGYVCIDQYLNERCIGNHVVKGKVFCYYKYRDVYQTYRSHGWEWDSGAFMGGNTLAERAKQHFNYFLSRWVMTKKRDYLWCIAGMMDGIFSPVEHKSKDLKDKTCKISAKAAVPIFMDWYRRNGREFQMASYLF